MLKKLPFELHFDHKPNTEWSQAYQNVVHSDTSAQRLERNLLTPDQIASQDYSRDRAKVVPRGSASPTINPRFKPMFSLEDHIAESEPYKALAELARAENKWKQYKRNLPPDEGKRVLKELTSRHSDLAQSLKTGLTHNTLRFSECGSSSTPPGAQTTSRRLPALQLRRPTKQVNWKIFSYPILVELESLGKLYIVSPEILLIRLQKSRLLRLPITLMLLAKEKFIVRTMFALSIIFVITFQ